MIILLLCLIILGMVWPEALGAIIGLTIACVIIGAFGFGLFFIYLMAVA